MAAKTALTLLVLAVVFVSSHQVLGFGRGSIVIENNGYLQILIAINENVPENDQLVDRIKEVFTSASVFLYKATRTRAFFKEIKILIPDSWPDKAEYEAAARETYGRSDVIIVEKSDSCDDDCDTPFVKNVGPCGSPGEYMHLTTRYLLDRDIAAQYGPYEKVLVHQWAHLRYGVFDEFATKDFGKKFFSYDDGTWKPTRCSEQITGEEYNVKTGDICYHRNDIPDDNCQFRADTNLDGAYASLMYSTLLDYVVEFCDNDDDKPKTLHNRFAVNEHNKLCDGQSVWEVIRSHKDFKDKNPPRSVPNTSPRFKVIHKKMKSVRVVLVLDVSGSMTGNKIQRLGQGCVNYIKTVVMDGDKVGIVTFNSHATAVKELTQINATTRSQLTRYVPTRANGGTNIGAGIIEGVQMLRRDPDGTLGAAVIVVTDGKDGSLSANAILNQTLELGITIHSIAITNAADSRLDAIAIETGGLPFLYSDQDNSNALNEAFQAIGGLSAGSSKQKYTIRSDAFTLAPGDYAKDEIIIDAGLGHETEFIFDYSGPGIKVNLTSPSDQLITEATNSTSHSIGFGIYTITIPGIAEEGKWRFTILNQQAVVQKVAVSVLSRALHPDKPPVIAQAFWGLRQIEEVYPGPDLKQQSLHASVTQGSVAVLRAKVTALVERPDGSNVFVSLLDNGAGADIRKDDGVYSAFFIQFTGKGRYGAKVSVNGSDVTVVSPRRIIGQLPAVTRNKRQAPSDTPTGLFQRVASGGSFDLGDFSGLGRKLYPPMRIIDLTVVAISYDDMTVSLQWTAVGDQLDFGQATSYELRMALSREQIISNFSSQTLVTSDMTVRGGNLTSPQPAHQVERFVVAVPSRGNISYTFAVVARDEDGRNVTGALSNAVSASLRYFPSPPDTTSSGVMSPDATSPDVTSLDAVPPEGISVAVIVGISVGVAVFVIVIVVVVLVVICMRNKSA